MSETDLVIRSVHQGFGGNAYPGDAFLQGSFDGCEPYEEVGAFKGRTEWAALEPEFLDAHYTALSFFSEAGFRFFLPAYLVADLAGRLLTADPGFHLTHGFSEGSLEERRNQGVAVHRWGRSVLLNPRRYGAATWEDYARYRLSVFTREEASAIVSYLTWKRGADRQAGVSPAPIDRALELFWLERARTAPSAADLDRHGLQERW